MDNIIAVGLIVNSALYFACVFALALFWRCDIAAITVVIAIGATYFSYVAQFWASRLVAAVLVALSISLGFASLIALFLQHFA